MAARCSALTQATSAGGTCLCVAEGNTIDLRDLHGHQIRKLQTDGKIRVLRWWDEPKLLLAGCVDEKVIAFDEDGRRSWVFSSQMDPAVYEAAKTYWFKSAPGHEGIHGLFTGEFDGGKSRCFVGSACTLEILDERGALVRRTPIFWGPCGKFLLAACADGSKNLLVSQWPNGSDDLAIVNSKTLTNSGRGYYGVPAGHTLVGGWDSQNRTAIFHEDFNGDGNKEVVTAINGTWNRVTVYSEQGEPLYNAQFGPGVSSTPPRNARHGRRRPKRQRLERDRRRHIRGPGRRPESAMREDLVDAFTQSPTFPTVRQAVRGEASLGRGRLRRRHRRSAWTTRVP